MHYNVTGTSEKLYMKIHLYLNVEKLTFIISRLNSTKAFIWLDLQWPCFHPTCVHDVHILDLTAEWLLWVSKF